MFSNSLQIATVNKALYKWFEALNVVPKENIVRMEQNVFRPETGIYIGFKVLSGPMKTGLTDSAEYVSEGTWRVWGHREMTYSVTVFRKGAGQVAAKIHDSHEIQAIRDILRAYSISIIDVASPSDISYKIETGFEERYSVDVRLRVMSEWTEDRGKVSTLTASGALTSDSGTVTNI